MPDGCVETAEAVSPAEGSDAPATYEPATVVALGRLIGNAVSLTFQMKRGITGTVRSYKLMRSHMP